MRRGSSCTAAVVLCAALALPIASAGPASAVPRLPAPPAPTAAPAAPAADSAPVISPALAAAQAAAAQLTAKVAALRTATELAVEDYNEVAARLKVAQANHAIALRQLRSARAAQARADRIADQRVRDIYITGGPPGLLDLTVGTGPGMDPFHFFDDARFVLSQDRKRFAAAVTAATASAAAAQRMAATLATQQRLTREAAGAQRAVQAKLAAEERLLASASAEVQAVLAAEARAQQQAAESLAELVRDAQRRARSAGVALSADITLSPFLRQVLAGAESELGKPYRWGATGPAAYDCSGFVQHAFAAAGRALPRTSRQQWHAGPHPAIKDVQPGDLLFWANGSDPATIHHVAIYLGAGYMIAAPHTGSAVRVQPVYDSGFFGVTRIAPPAT